MASQFENAGLGNFGREGQFSRGGPINELVKLLPAFGAAYGLVKSGAVDKLNADNWLSNPKKAMSNAILGSAPPADAGKNGTALGGLSPLIPLSLNESISPNGAISNFENSISDLEKQVKNWNSSDATSNNSTQPVAPEALTTFNTEGASSAAVNSGHPQQSNLDAAHQENSNAVLQAFPTVSPITVNPLKETNANQAASSDAALSRASEPSSNPKPVNPGGGSDIGAQIGLSILSKFLAL